MSSFTNEVASRAIKRSQNNIDLCSISANFNTSLFFNLFINKSANVFASRFVNYEIVLTEIKKLIILIVILAYIFKLKK